MYVSYVTGENSVQILNAEIGDDVIGRHMRIDGKWVKILAKDGDTLTVNASFTEAGSCYTNIVTMNEITVTLSNGAELTKLEFIYKPTFQ